MFTQTTQIPRSPLASTLTVVLHVGLALLVVVVSAAVPNIPKVSVRDPLTFITALPVPDLLIERPAPPPPLVKPRVEAPKPEPPKLAEAPIIERPPAAVPPPVDKRVLDAPKDVPSLPKPPQVVVGAFSDATAATKRTERLAPVEAAGFDTAAAQTSRTQRDAIAVGGFDTNLPTASKPSRTAIVADSGFGGTPAAGPTRQGPRATAVAGFSSDAAPKAAAPAPRPSTQPAGFADSPAAPRPAPAAPTVLRADRPVEVLSKPTPAYTDEARAQRIEGEVALEVEFTAAGQVRVLRVLRGLGYGLDDMAKRAAEQIRFRPATSAGVPVDFRATLTILFRLT